MSTGIFNFMQEKRSDFGAIRISIADPVEIEAMSFGEVTKPDTVNYRTMKPENGGLFCARIFGPVRDYECSCGKYKRMKYRGIVCEKCGVEVTTSKVRRERMGHIMLAAPMVHPWFFRSVPSRIGMILDISLKDLERALYCESYMVSNPGTTTLKYGQLLSEVEYEEALNLDGNFEAGMGAEAIQRMLAELNLTELSMSLRSELARLATGRSSEAKVKNITRRLRLIESMKNSGIKPEWMVITVLPVLPPELRPLVTLDGGRFATSDLNDLYRRVLNRNYRLKRIIELKAPEIMVRNEKRMLQEAIDNLFDGSSNRNVKGRKFSAKRAPKSLGDTLKGKQGRFRQNLLGKRVDYSGRSVIVVGPELKLHQCGLPKKIALELFKPFVYAKLEMYGLATTIKTAKKMVENERPEVWDILEEVIHQHPVLLNRAPTLHRLSVQAFEPVLIEGKAIQLHPLVCTAFNADFDGDQIAVHVPLSIEAQLEVRILMMSINNILSPANGKPIIVPTKDIVLGLYYLTLELDGEDGEGGSFSGIAEIEHALHAKSLSLHAKIKCRRKFINIEGEIVTRLVETTPGRVILSELIPEEAKISFDMVNKVMKKNEVSKLVEEVYRVCGQANTVIFSDKVMQLGFRYACTSGISFGKDDIIVPPTKAKHIAETQQEVEEYDEQYGEGLITAGERYNKVVDAWLRCSDAITVDMMDIMSGKQKIHLLKIGQKNLNGLYMMADAGARGSIAQIKQLGAMRGLMAKQSGEIIATPILSNFKSGLNILEYFNSAHGARKGSADTALRTANSGYLTRKLADVSQDCVVTEENCGTDEGLTFRAVIENGITSVTLGDTILGRVTAADIYHPVAGKIIAAKNTLIDEKLSALIEESGIDVVKLRSPITCKTPGGICTYCYGRDLSTGDQLVSLGEAVGIIAAQSIGEPGTQLTMRTFHIGGAAQKTTVQSNAISSYNGQIKLMHKNAVTDSKGRSIVMSRNCEALVLDEHGCEKARHKIPYGASLLVSDEEHVKAMQRIAEWDPFTIPIITETSGIAVLADIFKGRTLKESRDEVTGIVSRVIVESKSSPARDRVSLQPRVLLTDENGTQIKLSNGADARYFLPINAIITVEDKESVHAGDIIARIPKESSKTRDITGGLPRVAELFEARQPRDHSIISEVTGYVEFGKDYKSKRRIIVRSEKDPTQSAEYFVQRGRYITVNEGDYISRGEMIMEGTPSPHDILQVMGVEALAQHMISEIQQVYRLQGVLINDKHIEVVLAQMLRKVEIKKPGGTTFLVGEQVDKEDLEEVNAKAIRMGYEPAEGITILQGITRAALQTRSFLSAASFQETTRVLTDAAVTGKIDPLRGLKESVIAGRLIPAGTGLLERMLRKYAMQKDKEMLARRTKRQEAGG